MLPTLLQVHAACQHSTLAATDRVLFQPAGWFAIDAGNQRVPGVVPGSLNAALDLVGRGRVATVVGRLRRGVVAVDVDVAGERGHAIADEVVGWCAARGVWHLVRPSGGADGRTHVLTVPGGRAAELEDLVVNVRARWRVSRTAVDLRVGGRPGRDGLRPLSAPHRSGAVTHPLGDLTEATAALRQVLPVENDQTPVPARGTPPPETTGPASSVAPLAPRPRKHPTPLPEVWTRYLATGQAPQVGGEDQSRSAIEQVATGHLLRAGHDAASAWQTIQTAHPDAMTKTRAQGRPWWVQYVWNRAVEADTAWRDTHAQSTSTAGAVVVAAVTAAHQRLDEAVWAVSPRRRPTLLRVGDALLARMLRTDTTTVPAPERNLVEDTGIADRKTVRSALHQLHDAGVWRLRETFDPDHREASSHEISIPHTPRQGVRHLPPPALDTPLPTAYPLPGLLPAAAYPLWRTLTVSPHPTPAEELCQTAHLTQTKATPPTTSQVRTTGEALQALARAGLATCTEHGTWTTGPGPTRAYQEAVQERRAELAERVAAERAEYRARTSTRWSVGRAAALKKQRATEKAWWDGLDPTERTRRRTQYRQDFASLTLLEQEHRKAAWAARRVAAGENEATRHDRWLDSQSMDHVIHESIERSAAFARLPYPVRRAQAESWARHRERYRIPRGTPLATSRLEHATMLPNGPGRRDDDFLIKVGTSPRSLVEFERADAVMSRST